MRPLGEWAFRLLKKIIENKDIVLYSDLVVEELSKDFGEKEIAEIFEIIKSKGLLEKVNISKEQVSEAIQLKNKFKIPLKDAIHAIISRDSYAILVSNDNHFSKLKEIMNVRKPEELI